MGLVIIALTARWWIRNSIVLAVARIIGVTGVISVLASSTPFPVPTYCIWFVLWLATSFFPAGRPRRLMVSSFLVLSALLCLLELNHHLYPVIPVTHDQHIYVIGDSISAGVGSAERNWPLVLGDISRLQVTNLSRPGATAATALSQEDGIALPNSLVLIEVGGNDLLGSASSDEFSRSLETLLSGMPHSCSCAMFELPLLPFHNGYGEAQRALARKHNVILIPKKCLASVIGGDGNTLDGLHLSQDGHDALARIVFSMLRITR